MSLTYATVCSGIEAPSVAFEPLGWEPLWFSEIEAFPCALLSHRYPNVLNAGDMTLLTSKILNGSIPAPDIFCGGTPCQAFSVAGLRQSLGDDRGNLTLVFVELINAIDHVRRVSGKPPVIVLWENVPGVFSTKDNAFGCFLASMVGESEPLQPAGGRWSNAGAVYGPERTAAWRVLDAQYFGLAQRRKRVFVVSSARNGFDAAAVLFESNGMRRDFAPSRETGQSVAGILEARTTGGGFPGTDAACSGYVTPVTFDRQSSGEYGEAPIASTVSARDYKSASDLIAHTLRGEGFDASEDGTGRGTPLVAVSVALRGRHGGATAEMGDDCAFTVRASGGGGDKPYVLAFTSKDHGADAGEIAPTLRAMNHTNSHANGGGQIAIAIQDVSARDKNQNGKGWTDEGLSYTIAAQGVQGVGITIHGTDKTVSVASYTDLAGALRARPPGGIENSSTTVIGTELTAGMQVRRLTPMECERLQGFPDAYTLIPWRNKSLDECPDGPRYKALGNSMAVPVIRWLGNRIQYYVKSAA